MHSGCNIVPKIFCSNTGKFLKHRPGWISGLLTQVLNIKNTLQKELNKQ